MKKNLKEKTVVISAASLILSGLAYAEVRTPAIDSNNDMSVPEPYLPETQETPFSWNFISENDRSFHAQMSIRSAQQTLNDLGYSIQVDGIAGPETKEAIRDFQAANGIAQTGRLDTSTVVALREAHAMDTDRTPASYDIDRILIEGEERPAFPGGSGPNRNVPR